MNQLFSERRVSQMNLGQVYFWTVTVNGWKHLLKKDKYKQIILESIKRLSEKGLITIYSFVIMPNHLHFIWQLNKLNGKEKPHASFNKETSHLIIKDLKANHPAVLPFFEEKTKDRNFRIWKRDPMAIHMDSKLKTEQKIDYIHRNPLTEKWNLAAAPENYLWSSASFYFTGDNSFDFLTDYREYFG